MPLQRRSLLLLGPQIRQRLRSQRNPFQAPGPPTSLPHLPLEAVPLRSRLRLGSHRQRARKRRKRRRRSHSPNPKAVLLFLHLELVRHSLARLLLLLRLHLHLASLRTRRRSQRSQRHPRRFLSLLLHQVHRQQRLRRPLRLGAFPLLHRAVLSSLGQRALLSSAQDHKALLEAQMRPLHLGPPRRQTRRNRISLASASGLVRRLLSVHSLKLPRPRRVPLVVAI
mmetsp:Transcript_10099/g.28614  ORF Transcript_10099/g.28614 Transcript_10099/m.28614 type:complete len:225 (-) Transcript_10099:1790-2464(-)